MSKLLFLTQRIPYPPNKGEKIRSWQLMRHLSRSHELHLGCLVDDPADWAHVDHVKSLCADSYFASLDRRQAKLLCLRGLLTGEPLSVLFFKHRGLKRWVDAVLDTVQPDIIFVSSSNMAPYILNHPHHGRARIIDLVDVDSEKWFAYSQHGAGPMRWVHTREGRLVRELEFKIARETTKSLFVSDAEAQFFRDLAPESTSKIVSISNGVDFDYFDNATEYAAPFDTARPNYVFTGTMDYAPNSDAVIWFAEAILPIIRETQPDAQFHIVGGGPPPSVTRLAELPGVNVTGRVADVRPYIAHATACVAPMRIARGIQNKVLEAMAMGRPTIVTSDALEGIDALPGRDVLLANDAPGFANAVCSVLGENLGPGLGSAARQLVQTRYAWSSKLRELDDLVAASM